MSEQRLEKKVVRWSWDEFQGHIETENGEMVKYSDYEALKKRESRLEAIIRHLKVCNRCAGNPKTCNTLIDLEAALSEGKNRAGL